MLGAARGGDRIQVLVGPGTRSQGARGVPLLVELRRRLRKPRTAQRQHDEGRSQPPGTSNQEDAAHGLRT